MRLFVLNVLSALLLSTTTTHNDGGGGGSVFALAVSGGSNGSPFQRAIIRGGGATATATTLPRTTTTHPKTELNVASSIDILTSRSAGIYNNNNNGDSLSSINDAKKKDDEQRPMHILFLSADTGGGHRASAEALAKQFLIQYPGSTYELADVWTDHGVFPFQNLVPFYTRMSAHPIEWKLFYHLSNTKLNEVCSNLYARMFCGRRIRKRIESHNPDLIVSVHPTMNHTPLKNIKVINKKLGKHIPFFTVVTDLGSAHCMWFERKVDKLYVASDRLYKLARRRGGTSHDDIVMTGLPIRHGFAEQAELLGGDRTSEAGKAYQKMVREQLNIPATKQCVLVMGGGEGVGSLSDIVNGLYAKLATDGVDATICVVCGRNEKLQQELITRNFDHVTAEINAAQAKYGGEGRVGKRRRMKRFVSKKILQRNKKNDDGTMESTTTDTSNSRMGNVDILPLGFLTNIPEYMVAADVLVTKAGPGTIAEAAAVGLPVMMTSFLPGQEAGNVDVVLESNFGEFQKEPSQIAATVSEWLQDSTKLTQLSKAAMTAGNPYAAVEIVEDIGRQTMSWMKLNEQ